MLKFTAFYPVLAAAAGLAMLAGPEWSAAQATAAREMSAALLPRPAPTTAELAIRAASEKDQQHMLQLLGIKKLRSGASFPPSNADPANYDESKADTHLPLPNPLMLTDGKPVTSAEMWWSERRPQIVELFNRDILGRVPEHLPAVAWEVESATRQMNGAVPVITKKLIGRVQNADPAVEIELILTTPADAPGAVPVMMEMAFARDFDAAWKGGDVEQETSAAGEPGPNWQQQVLARGWGYAMLSPTSFQADDGAGLTAGIIGLMNHGRERKPEDWGALQAWAWGASRALDYFQSDPAVDAHQVGIMGHSRMGKAALVAMAYERRFAVAYISSSGEGGAKLYRHNFGEQIGNLASAGEYHWMGGNFLKYDGPLKVADLPVDAHELIALCAPRPVFIGGGAAIPSKDGWADAEGMFDAAVAAGPVYRLLGRKDLGTNVFPPIETPLTSGDLAFRQHAGGHTPAPNWPTFLEFASRYLQIRTPPVLASNAPR